MTQIIVSMQDFLRSGEFGPIRLGISRDQLRGHLGDPEDWGPFPKSERHATIWKYGDIEFHFNEDTLWLIFADNVEKLRGGRAIDLDPWVLNGGALVGQVLECLAAARIPHPRIDWPLNDNTERFLVGGGVELLFLDETQHIFEFDSEGPLPISRPSPLARPGMTFDGFSYSSR